MATIDHPGCELLPGSAGRRAGTLCKAGDLQHRSRQPVHQRGLDGHTESLRLSDLQGWQGPLAGQRVHRAAVALAQAGVCVPQCLRLRARLPGRHRRVDGRLQSRTNTLKPRRSHAQRQSINPLADDRQGIVPATGPASCACVISGRSRRAQGGVVPRRGLEPPPTCVDMDLNHARLPIPPPGQGAGRRPNVSGDVVAVKRL